jgi:hypothetical protein
MSFMSSGKNSVYCLIIAIIYYLATIQPLRIGFVGFLIKLHGHSPSYRYYPCARASGSCLSIMQFLVLLRLLLLYLLLLEFAILQCNILLLLRLGLGRLCRSLMRFRLLTLCDMSRIVFPCCNRESFSAPMALCDPVKHRAITHVYETPHYY